MTKIYCVHSGKDVIDIYSGTPKYLQRLELHETIFQTPSALRIKFADETIETSEDQELIDFIFEKDEHHSSHRVLKYMFKVSILEHSPGEYYPRIFRPVLNSINIFLRNPQMLGNAYVDSKISMLESRLFSQSSHVPVNNQSRLSGINQLTLFFQELNDIFLTIEPRESNLNSFGQRTRNLLILTCTEIEAQFTGILSANNLSKERYSTADFIKLRDILRLREYSLELGKFPWVGKFSPYLLWEENNPTKSLSWYHAYNKVKHNRENEFHHATLNNLLQALAALNILIYAQYGDSFKSHENNNLESFKLVESPRWLIDHYYIPPFTIHEWEAISIE